MKEIRLHGIGGMGTVKAGEILVHAAVSEGRYGNSMPFFGFERQGAPVTAFVRLDEKPIRPKNKVYNPDCVLILDPSLLVSANVFEGLREGSVFILNTASPTLDGIIKNKNVTKAAFLDATAIALDVLDRAVPNTVILGAFAQTTGWVDAQVLEDKVAEFFGGKNREAFRRGYQDVKEVDLP